MKGSHDKVLFQGTEFDRAQTGNEEGQTSKQKLRSTEIIKVKEIVLEMVKPTFLQ